MNKSSSNKLIAIARSKDKLDQLINEYSDDRVGIVAGDVTDESTLTASIELAKSKFGQINSVIANAGVLDPVSSIEQAKLDDWKWAFDINFFSVVNLAKLALPELRKTKGNFIGVSSGAAVSAYNGWGAYGSSKAALNNLMLTIAEQELDVKSLAIAPGVVDTDMQANIRNKAGKNMQPDALKKFTNLYENKQLLLPEVPAKVYANLALKSWSDDVNGQYLRFNDDKLASYKD